MHGQDRPPKNVQRARCARRHRIPRPRVHMRNSHMCTAESVKPTRQPSPAGTISEALQGSPPPHSRPLPGASNRSPGPAYSPAPRRLRMARSSARARQARTSMDGGRAPAAGRGGPPARAPRAVRPQPMTAHVHTRRCTRKPMCMGAHVRHAPWANRHRSTGTQVHANTCAVPLACTPPGVHTTRRAQRHMCAPATEHTCTWAPKHSNTGAQGNMCPRTHVRACKRWAGKGTANVHMGCAAHVHRGRSLRKRRGHPGRVHGESCAHVQAATTGPCAPDAGCTCAHWRHGQLPSSSRAHAHMCTWPPTPADHAVQSPPCTCARVRLYSNNSKSLRLHPRTRLQPPARVPGFV